MHIHVYMQLFCTRAGETLQARYATSLTFRGVLQGTASRSAKKFVPLTGASFTTGWSHEMKPSSQLLKKALYLLLQCPIKQLGGNYCHLVSAT